MAQQLSARQPRYKRILLKLSGEALMGSEEFGIDPKVLDRMALEIGQLVGIGVQVGLVIGGGNLFFRAELLDLDFSAGDESLEVRLFDEAEIPWSELAFPTIGRTLECYFSDRREGCFPVRNEAIAPMLASYKKD